MISSIRLRLALWFGLLAVLAVLLVSLFTYAIHTRAHYDDVDRSLVTSAEHIAEEYLVAQESGHGLESLTVTVAPDVVARIFTADGQLLVASQNGGAAPLVDPLNVSASGPPYDLLARLSPAFVDVPQDQGTFDLATAGDDQRWRVYLLELEDEHLLVEASIARIDDSVRRFRLMLLLVSTLGIATTFTTSALLAGRALRPVATLTATASAIARSRGFGQRVPVGDERDELGRLAVTFNEMLQSLEDSYRSQQRFVADASHELRAPLTVIQANLELLERRPNLGESERQEAFQDVSREAQRLTRLVSDLLVLARADAGVPLRRQQVELDRLVLEAYAEARLLARGQRLEIRAMEPVVVEGDPDRLKQLLLILLDNAIKYTPQDGVIAVGLKRTGSDAEVTVQDTGVGIAREALPKVFDRFFRADPARSRDPGGTGLGLPIARWIAQQHSGDITLTSDVGSGTTATVRLPRSTDGKL